MLASYQFVPQKMSDQLPQKMGGGFRFRYRSAYAKNCQPQRVSQQKVKPQLTQIEINEAMSQLLERPQNTRRNMITKPVGVDFDSDFQKMASAEATVKNALRLLSSIQKLQKPEVEKEVLTLGILSGANSNRDLLQAAKYKTTAEANNFISNVTLQQTPESSATPGNKSGAVLEQKYGRRPQSSVNQSGVKAKPIELDRMAKLEKADDRQACGTLTPHSDLNRQEKSVKVFNQLFEVQSSQKSRKRLIKSNSNTTRNADIENILNMNEPQFGSNADINREQVFSAQPVVSEAPHLFTTDDARTPFSVNEDSNNVAVKQNAMASQTPPYNQLPIQILSERQIGHPALVSNKTNFSQIAWNISLMRQDSYDPTSSKDQMTFHHSERMLQNPVTVISEHRSGQLPINQPELSENSLRRLSATKIHKKNRPVTGRPALVNLNSHKNIEKVLMQQDQQRQIIRTLSTAQINKLSAGALQQQGRATASNLTRLLPSTAVLNRNNQDSQVGAAQQKTRKAAARSSQSQLQMQLSTYQRDQPVKVKFILQQIDEKGFQVHPLQQQSNDQINVMGVKLQTIETAVDKLTISSQQNYKTQKAQGFDRQSNLNQDRVIVQQTEGDISGREQQATSELVQPSIKSRISIQSKSSPTNRNQVKTKYEITKHLDHNLQEVETLKKVSGNLDYTQTESWNQKPLIQSGPNLTGNQNAAKHRSSTILEIDPFVQKSDNDLQHLQKAIDQQTTFGNIFPTIIPSETIQMSAFGSTISKPSYIPARPVQTHKVYQKFSPIQRKSFNENIANLARIISAQSEIEKASFEQKYINLIEKHTRKNWIPNQDPRLKELKPQKQTDMVQNQKTQSSGRNVTQRVLYANKPRSHALAFLDLKSIVTGNEPLTGIRTIKVSRPQTTKSTSRVAIIQQKQAPLPPPSAKDQRRIGADINFLKFSGQSSTKAGSAKQMVDIGMSNFQLIMKNSDLKLDDDKFVVENYPIFKGIQKQDQSYDGKPRMNTANSNLFERAKAGKPSKQITAFECEIQS